MEKERAGRGEAAGTRVDHVESGEAGEQAGNEMTRTEVGAPSSAGGSLAVPTDAQVTQGPAWSS